MRLGSEPTAVDAGGVTLSGLVATPAQPPAGTLLALHGGGARAAYYDAPADPGSSLLNLAAARGWTALAVDRPGYGASRWLAEQGHCDATRQAELLGALVENLEPPVFVVAHSLGALVALHLLAREGVTAVGLAVAGVPLRYTARQLLALSEVDLSGPYVRGVRSADPDAISHWGPSGTWDPQVLRYVDRFGAPVPSSEFGVVREAPGQIAALAARIAIPVLWTFLEHEGSHAGAEVIEPLVMRLFPQVELHHQQGSGHNVSLHHAAREYHDYVLDFADRCRERLLPA